MKKPGKSFITGRLSESFYLGDLPPKTLPEMGLSKLLLMMAVHFGRKNWPPAADDSKKNN